MLSFRSRGTSRPKKAGLAADDANDDVGSSIDSSGTIGSAETRARGSMSLRGRLGLMETLTLRGLKAGSGNASGMRSADCGKSGNDNRGPASGGLLVKHSAGYQGNNSAAIKSAGVYGDTKLKHSEEDGVGKTAGVKHPEDGDDKDECDRVDQPQGSGSDSGRVAADPGSAGREASAEGKTAAVGLSTGQLTGTAIDFNTPPHPPQQVAGFPCERFPSLPPRPPGPGQPANAQLRGLPPVVPTAAAGRAFRASTASGAYPPSNLRPYSPASTASSSATMTPTTYSRRNLPVENSQIQYPPAPRRLHHSRQQQPPPQQSANYQPPQRPGPIRSGGGFPQSYSSSSSAKTGNSSASPTTESLESTESPPPLEPKDPGTKPSSEESITPSQAPNLEQARALPGPCYSQSYGPPNSQIFVKRPQHPTYPYPLQQRTMPRPLRSAPFFHEGLYFAQISYNTVPEEAMAGPELSCVQYPPFHLAHLDCMAQHKVMHKVHNIHHSVPCMTCRTMGHGGAGGTIDKSDDPADYRFVCGWCAIRICTGCRDELRFQDNRLMDLLRVLGEREGNGGPGDPNAPSQLKIEVQPRVPDLGGTKLPVDSSAPAQATSTEELSNLSHFGPPGYSGDSAPMSRPSTGNSESETCDPQGRLMKFREYDGEPCWPPPTRGKRHPILDQRAELTNIGEYPRQRISSHTPIEPSGVTPQRRSNQRLPDPLQRNQRGPTPQPSGQFVPQRRSPKLDSPKPRKRSDGESEAPVGSTDGRQTHQQAQLPHQVPPPREPSPLLQVSPPRGPSPPRQPSPPERGATPLSTLGAIGQQEVPLTPPPKSPRRKESPPISAPTVGMVDISGTLRVSEPEVSQSKVMQPEVKDLEAKQTKTEQPEVSRAQIEKPEAKLPEAKKRPTPSLGRPQVEKKQEMRAGSPLPGPGPQRESAPRPGEPPRSTPSPRPEPTQATKVGEKLEGTSHTGRGTPRPVTKLPEPEVLRPEPAAKPMHKPTEPVLAAKPEKPVQPPIKQEKALPEPPKPVKSMIADFPISKPVTSPEERPIYPTKPEPKIDLSYYNLKPATTRERYKLSDDMQLPEIDFGGTLDTMAMTDGILGRPARTHEKPPAAPIRRGGGEKEGSISGSIKDKKKWRLPGFGKKKVERK
ncbi:unnamed protein product [Tuber aestivum]|uniref:Uncharacterized protein n=1 Tax=Tuber aestivum TaxID=59557 RepID=A0A292PYP8_9PEZI|nr:unnamed protein product [Tuber aestivum]